MTLLAPFDTAQQPAIPKPWRLSPEARDYIVGTQEQRPELEATFACGVDLTAKIVTTATLCGWGTSREALLVLSDFKPGTTLMIHTHPGIRYQQAAGSDPDLRCAVQLAERGIGFGIVNGDGVGLLVMREPRPWREPVGPLARVWTWRRWTLIYSPRS